MVELRLVTAAPPVPAFLRACSVSMMVEASSQRGRAPLQGDAAELGQATHRTSRTGRNVASRSGDTRPVTGPLSRCCFPSWPSCRAVSLL